MKCPKQKFKRLKAIWYAKLAASGFDDIEKPNGKLRDDVRMDDERHPRSFSRVAFVNAQRYYELATQIAMALSTRDPRSRIWLAHAAGWSNREIEKMLHVSRYLIGRDVRELSELIYIQARSQDGGENEAG